MVSIQGIPRQNYAGTQTVKRSNSADSAAAAKARDQYSYHFTNTPAEEQKKNLTDKQIENFAEKYDLQNMDRSQLVKLLAELRDTGAITEREFSISYAGVMPKSGEGAPVWPQGSSKVDFVQFLGECAEHCRAVCDRSADSGAEQTNNVMLATTYSDLRDIFLQISNKREPDKADIDEIPAEGEISADKKEDPLAQIYSSKVLSLYEQLKNDETWINNKRKHCLYNSNARELAKELFLSDTQSLETLAKEIWIYRAENNQFRAENGYADRLHYLPKDYTGIVDEIKGKLLCGSSQEQAEVFTEIDAFLARKAKRERLTDVERLLSGFAAEHEKATWQNFDERMDSVENLIKDQFNEAGYSFDVNKKYQFYLDTKTFTFSVTGGTAKENELIANAINTHPRESYKFDPLHTALMAMYGSRREDLSYNPWQTSTLPSLYGDELLQKYGTATDVSASYTKKMRQFIAAYQMHELDDNMKWKYGFGVDDIVYANGRFEGKTEAAAKYLSQFGDDFMVETGYAYRDLLNKYTGTPEFESAVFVFENGKFKLTYEQ
ncbi:MAG: hypothetical protein K2O45_00010 [Oscillospiraceae bacterium]|nr:hypothetical protein [Oscillospiraceae bacterium]